MTAVWPKTRLAEVLRPVSRPEPVDPEKTYRILGARWYAEGLYTKDVKGGDAIRARTLYRIREGDFVYNRLFAWKGSFGVASKANDGCYASNEFLAYDADAERLDENYLWRYFSLPSAWEEALGRSSGSTPTSRNRLKGEQLLTMTVPLPPLSEQRRIVARVEELATKIEEARRLRRKTAADLQGLSWSFLFGGMWPTSQIPMGEVLTLKNPDVEVEGDSLYRFAGVYSFGRGVFLGQYKRGSDFAYRRLTYLQKDNFVYPKLMAWEGALGVVPPDCDGLVVSPEFPVFEVNEDKVLPEVLDTYFRSPHVWPLLSAVSTGTNLRRRRLHPDAFLNVRAPLPSMEVQLKFRELRTKLRVIEQNQVEVSAELDVLLPSVLERVLRGDL